MSAREELLEMLRYHQPGSWVARPEDDAAIDAFRDEVLREAAEKIRAEAERRRAKTLDNPHKYIDPEEEAEYSGMESAADFIDPNAG